MLSKTKKFVLASLIIGSAATNQARSNGCDNAPNFLDGVYPEHELSPKQSLRLHDAVFLGEVVVPLKPCSLGFCAGFRVLGRTKGHLGNNVLVSVPRTAMDSCGPTVFKTKGSRWMVFANAGTSKTGYQYFQTMPDSPSFVASAIPDFNTLERRYQTIRTRLDYAIEEHVGHRR